MLLIIRLKVSVRSLLTAELLRAGRYESSERVGRGCCPVQYRSESGIVGFTFTAAPREKKKNMAAAECAANDLRK